MDKNTILKLAPLVLKRMEYGIDRFYLLNFSNDDIWIGNYASFVVISQIDGVRTIHQIVKNIQDQFEDYTCNQVYEAIIEIANELVKNGFLINVK